MYAHLYVRVDSNLHCAEIAYRIVNFIHFTHAHTCTLCTLHEQLALTVSLMYTKDEQQYEQQQHQRRAQDEGMLICQRAADLQPDTSSKEDLNWTAVAQSYPNLEEAQTFFTRNRKQAAPRTFSTSASPDNLQGWQLEVYTITLRETTHHHSG